MAKGKTIIGAVLLGAMVGAFLLTWSGGYRTCGHRRNLFDEFSMRRATHCCLAGSTVNELVQLYGAQEMYHHDHGSYAILLEQLTNGYLLALPDSPFELRATSNDWSCFIPRSERLPGSYLLCSDGRIYFTGRGAATTNSTLLRDGRTGFSIG